MTIKSLTERRVVTLIAMSEDDFESFIGNFKGAEKRLVRAEREIYLMAKERGFSILSPYTGVKDKILVRCENGHTYSVNANRFKRGRRCSVCLGSNPFSGRV